MAKTLLYSYEVVLACEVRLCKKIWNSKIKRKDSREKDERFSKYSNTELEKI